MKAIFEIIYLLIFITILSRLIFLGAILLGGISIQEKEKTSPFECGFEITYQNRVPFSVQFFLIGIVFVIFDLEIVIVLAIVFKQAQLTTNMIYILLFFIFLVGTLFVE